MFPSRRLTRAAAALGAVALLTACAPLTARSYIAPGADLHAFRTFAWEPDERLETGDPRLDNNPFFDARVQSAVEQQLARRGFEKSTAGRPDLLVHYHASIAQRLDVNGTDQQYGYCDTCTPFVYEAGTLVLDLVDAGSSRLVWRGWVEDTVTGVIDDQALLERRIDRAVERIFEKLPARL